MTKHASISPEEAADRLAIRELVEAYAHCADRRDAKGQMALFTPDAHFVVYMNAKDPTPSQELHSREELAPVFADLNRYAATMHFLGQATILTLTRDRGTAETYCMPHHYDHWQSPKPDDCRSPLYGHLREKGRRMAVCGTQALCRLAGTAGTLMNVPAAGQKRLVIVGATGMVGGYALRYALDHPAVGRVTAISRRKLGISHPKLDEVAASGLRGLLCTRGGAFTSGRGDLLPRYLYRVGIGRGTPQDNRGLHNRVRARSPRQQSWRGVLIPERKRRGPDRPKPNALCALQGRGRECTTRGRLPPCLHISTGVYLPRGAAQGTEPQLPASARNLSRVSRVLPQPGHSCRPPGEGNGGRSRSGNGQACKRGLRKP